MRNPAYDIRVASFDALDGSITYNGEIVPVYDTNSEDVAGFPRIILQGITGGGPRMSKCGFGSNWFQSIKISSMFKGGLTQNEVDIISDELLQILCPVSRPFLDLSPNFNVWQVESQVLNIQNYTDGASKYIDLDIQITYSLTEI